MRLALSVAILASVAVSSVTARVPLALIMLDGFRWDYATRLNPGDLPFFDWLSSTGTRAEYVQPIYPADSFPSWTSIVTGLRPKDHGIVGNYMYNRTTGKEFALAVAAESTTDPSWWQGRHVPLWTSATQEGKSEAYSEVNVRRCELDRHVWWTWVCSETEN